jgi:oligopeptide/dipeptide ABC transporter ATP-binding protein
VTDSPITTPEPATGATATETKPPLLRIEEMSVRFQTDDGIVAGVSGVSLEIDRGEIVAVVGESGSGKSVTAMTLMGLTRAPNTLIAGRARLDDLDLLTATTKQLEKVRGKRIAMIFQDPMSSLNPVHRVGAQIVEQLLVHEDMNKAQAKARAIELMGDVGIPRPGDRYGSYPHEFSGGMRQRVMIAMALSCSPELLIADEPTTALDVTVQAQILDVLMRLRDEIGMAIMLVTHDLGVVAQTADRVAVMYGGRIVEQADVIDLFDDPRHPYTWGLLGSIPPLEGARPERLPSIAGAPPSPSRLPSGCAFAPRCPHRFDRCSELPPLLIGGPKLSDAPESVSFAKAVEIGDAAPADGSIPTGGAGAEPGSAALPAALVAPDAHADRCWLGVDDKRTKRVVGDGSIGLLTGDYAA